jgi:hypothetical protein
MSDIWVEIESGREVIAPVGRSLERLVRVQDAGSHRREGQVPVYHTHGLRQYLGTAKLHARLTCPHLTSWKPGKHLGRTFMCEWEDSYTSVPSSLRCKTCFLHPNGAR